MCNLDDRETVGQISENIYMEYFLGYPNFTNESPFNASLVVEFRKRLGMDNLNAINEKIVAIKTQLESSHKSQNPITDSENENVQSNNQQNNINDTESKGR
ncbi:MAG: family transposase [Bacteroidetes bacterium]|nr:family transposase [Bacteroidota bacterium]